MNYTNFEHAFYALLMQAAIGLTTGDWFAGACFGVAFFLGREHAQAQRKHNLGDFAAFDMRRWSLDSRLDLIFPVIACAALLLGVSLFTKGA